MKSKGRLRAGSDADVVVFDAARVIDKATYDEPARYAEGVKYVLVNGVVVVKDGEVRPGVYPGRPIRAPH